MTLYFRALTVATFFMSGGANATEYSPIAAINGVALSCNLESDAACRLASRDLPGVLGDRLLNNGLLHSIRFSKNSIGGDYYAGFSRNANEGRIVVNETDSPEKVAAFVAQALPYLSLEKDYQSKLGKSVDCSISNIYKDHEHKSYEEFRRRASMTQHSIALEGCRSVVSYLLAQSTDIIPSPGWVDRTVDSTKKCRSYYLIYQPPGLKSSTRTSVKVVSGNPIGTTPEETVFNLSREGIDEPHRASAFQATSCDDRVSITQVR